MIYNSDFIKLFSTIYNFDGISIACADYKELCDIPELDLVCVTSPNRYHLSAVKYAMENLKPFTLYTLLAGL